jgi:hypothetical protein
MEGCVGVWSEGKNRICVFENRMLKRIFGLRERK